jgi:3-deoxy-D-manno-octulosonic-acid transferase
MHLLYTISIYLYLFAIKTASLFNHKARMWVSGRKNIFSKLESDIQFSHSNKTGLVWIHCASLGEFEQGRPVIEKIRLNHPELKILLTFFSPSGYEIRKNYKTADHVFYLPIDTPANAKRFIETIKPIAVFFVKYEFWFNYMSELKNRNIPTYLISGIFREGHYFFNWYGAWFRKQLNCFSHLFVQDNHSIELLASAGYENVTIAGDTRFDRVLEVAANVKIFPVLEQFKGTGKLFILGSSWPEDEKIVLSWMKSDGFSGSDFKFIIAPHEVNEERIQSILHLFSDYSVVRYSHAATNNLSNARILIIDNIGMLSSIYSYGTVSFIGGGFGKGIHNILEAAAFGLPVIFGPNYIKFTEAKELLRLGGAFSINNKVELDNTIALLNDPEILKTASHVSKHYVLSRGGATDKILSSISLK